MHTSLAPRACVGVRHAGSVCAFDYSQHFASQASAVSAGGCSVGGSDGGVCWRQAAVFVLQGFGRRSGASSRRALLAVYTKHCSTSLGGLTRYVRAVSLGCWVTWPRGGSWRIPFRRTRRRGSGTSPRRSRRSTSSPWVLAREPNPNRWTSCFWAPFSGRSGTQTGKLCGSIRGA